MISDLKANDKLGNTYSLLVSWKHKGLLNIILKKPNKQ